MSVRKLLSVILLSGLTAAALFSQPATAEDSPGASVDVSVATEYDLSVTMLCSGVNQSSASCEVYPTASNENGTLEGTISVAVCIYIDSNSEENSCYGSKPTSTRGKGPSITAAESVLYYDLELGQTSSIKVKNYTYGKKLYQEVVLEDSRSLANVFDGWEGSGKKYLSLSLTTVDSLLLGETKAYRITSSPKVTGTCTLYRSLNGSSLKVGSATLKKGVATGKLRWLWTTAGISVRMSLKASCGNAQYEGEKFTLVTGIRR